MSESKRPSWASDKTRLDQRRIEVWYKPEEHGNLEGVLLWQDDLSSERGPYHVFAIECGTTVYGVRERAGLKKLRRARNGSRVFIEYHGKRSLDGERTMLEFSVWAEESNASEPTAADASGPTNASGSDVPF